MIFLIRHGEAAAHWGAHPDPGLSARGHDQAIAVATQLSAEQKVEQMYSSPMQRCVETAQPLADLTGLEAQIEPAVTEIPTPSEVSDRRQWLSTLMAGNWADAPSLVQDWRTELCRRVENLPDHSAVFTHFVAINAIVSALENNPAVRVFNPGHASVTSLIKQDGQLTLHQREDQAPSVIL